jgi:PAP2 superfamily
MRTRSGRRALATALLVGSGIAALVAACGDARPPFQAEACTRDLGGQSVARVWDEQTLDLIRQVVPAPTVHARNLFHVSAAMWDAWAAYDPTADGYFVTEKQKAPDISAARETAMSYAAYRILHWRYGTVSDLQVAPEQLAATMARLCLKTEFDSVEGDNPAAFGNRIAAKVIEYGRTDGSLEDERYKDADYVPKNEPLVVAQRGTVMKDPNHWQPLALDKQLSQNGLPIPGQVQTFIGPHWGHVTSFALAASDQGTPIDPGPPPRLGDPATDQEFKDETVEIIRRSHLLDATNGVTIDISPGALGNNSLGTNDGHGRPINPATGKPYESHMVLEADFARVLAEYWADGPKSETPPGHWNVIANEIADSPDYQLRIGGQGEPVDRLEWDTKLYFALNGAVHDAAIATWGVKGFYDSSRPISQIRYMGERGQSTDPSGPSYDPQGLPLVPGLIEVATPDTVKPGGRHAGSKAAAGDVVIDAWRGFPKDPRTETSGVGWIRAVDWVPYQRATFVTPAFAGYPSGHSTFSRAAAEVLTAFTGSEYFPGGITSFTTKKGDLIHEEGPTQDTTIPWATYHDAADMAGISRLFMGIHVPIDDIEGRKIGAICGRDAIARALTYYDGTANP